MENPYQAPQAPVADPVVATRPKPSAVRRAILVLWVGWALGLVSLVPGVRAGAWDTPDMPVAIVLGLGAASGAFVAWLIVMTSRGRNWARWTLVVYIGITWAMIAIEPALILEQGLFATALDGFVLVLDAYGCILLLFGAGAAWFRRPRTAP